MDVSRTSDAHCVTFAGIYTTTTSNVIFDRLHCYEVTLVNNCKTLLQKSETKIFKQKRLTEKLVRSKQEKKVTRFEMKSDNV